MQKITTFLWFNDNAEEAANFYCSVFKNSRIKHVTLNSEAAPGPTGAVLIVGFELEGQEFLALNGGPQYSFTQAVSFLVNCETQEEVDEYWEKLSAGGQKIQCGWLTDKFGLAWQVTPRILMELIGDQDAEKASRVMQAMMQMEKIDIKKIQEAAEEVS
jgi:predicted 3-demethylubiquinone-9 3-methyltransferase (glyoxalase superfamily)